MSANNFPLKILILRQDDTQRFITNVSAKPFLTIHPSHSLSPIPVPVMRLSIKLAIWGQLTLLMRHVQRGRLIAHEDFRQHELWSPCLPPGVLSKRPPNNSHSSIYMASKAPRNLCSAIAPLSLLFLLLLILLFLLLVLVLLLLLLLLWWHVRFELFCAGSWSA